MRRRNVDEPLEVDVDEVDPEDVEPYALDAGPQDEVAPDA